MDRSTGPPARESADVTERRCALASCGKPIRRRLRTAKFCSSTCRVAHWRESGGVAQARTDPRLDKFVQALVVVSEDPGHVMTLPEALRAAGVVAGIDCPAPAAAEPKKGA